MVVLVLLVLLSATVFLAFSETSLIGAKRTRLQEWQQKGDQGARTALEVLKHSDALLSTIEVGVTAIAIIIGAYAQGEISSTLQRDMHSWTWMPPLRPSTISLLVVAIITYISLLCQIVPKRMALLNPEKGASSISKPISMLIAVLWPVVQVIMATANAISRLLPHPPTNQPPVTDAEVLMLVAQGTKAGVFEQVEHDMFTAILHLEDIDLSSLMTPRTEMQWLEADAHLQDVIDQIAACDNWELPVADGTADNVLGTINVRDSLILAAKGENPPLRQLLQPALFVPDTEDALFMLQTFRRRGHQSAILLDEFGGVTGIVSVRDVIEEIVGDISGTQSAHIRPVEGGKNIWIVDGLTPVEEFMQAFQLNDLMQEELPYSTVAGLIIEELGHIPHAGEELSWQGMQMKIVSLDGHRIDKIRLHKAA